MIERKYEFFRRNQLKCVYVIHNVELNRVKIGITDNIRARMSTLTGSSGCKLELKYTTPYFRKAKMLESLAHSRFKEFKVIGEWFDVSPKIAIRFLKGKLSKYMQQDECDFNDFIDEEKKKQSDRPGYRKRIGWKKLDLIRADLFFNEKIVEEEVFSPPLVNETIEVVAVTDILEVCVKEPKPCEIEPIPYKKESKPLKKHCAYNKPVYVIGEEVLLDRPLSKFKRIDKNLFKDKDEIVYEIHYINKQWIMKRLK